MYATNKQDQNSIQANQQVSIVKEYNDTKNPLIFISQKKNSKEFQNNGLNSIKTTTQIYICKRSIKII